MKIGLVLRTLAHLRGEQLIHRPIRQIQSRLDGLLPANRWTHPSSLPLDDSRVGEIKRVVRSLPHLNQPLTEIEPELEGLKNDRYTFLNVTRELRPVDWNVRYVGHLWNYNLHYFAYSYWCARAFAERGDDGALEFMRRSIESWIDGARPGKSDGWQPYPTSVRIVNWIYAHALVAESLIDDTFREKWVGSIHSQLEFLESRIEYHLLANHILKNAKALLIGGLFFNNRRWVKLGHNLLIREINEQVLPDGGHFERAPMYHAQTFADILESFLLLRTFGELRNADEGLVTSVLHRMASFLQAMTNRDGTLSLFNDSANVFELRPGPLLESAREVLGEIMQIEKFPQSGYFTWTSREGKERIIVDAGQPSVSYNTAHAHCDLLSYELWLNGHAFVVDSGVHGYDDDPFREYARSTRAHNTVVLDSLEQSEVWATFRMGARASDIRGDSAGDDSSWGFRGSYSPYFDRGLIHQRKIERDGSGGWSIVDTVSGGTGRTAESFIHLHPDVSVHAEGGKLISCRRNGAIVTIEPFGVDKVEVVSGVESPKQGWYFPDFGIALPCATIRMTTHVREGCEFGYRIRPEGLDPR